MTDINDDPVGVLREIHLSLTESAQAGEALEVMRQAAIQRLVSQAVQVEQIDDGGNSHAMRVEISAMAETSRSAGAATRDIGWTTLKQFLQATEQNLQIT